MPGVICGNGSSEQKLKNRLALFRKIAIFYSVFFISVKISAGLLPNLYGNLDEKLVSDQSSGLKEMSQGWMW